MVQRNLHDGICAQCGTAFRFAPRRTGHVQKFCSRQCNAAWARQTGGYHSRAVRTPIGDFRTKAEALKAFMETWEPL